MRNPQPSRRKDFALVTIRFRKAVLTLAVMLAAAPALAASEPSTRLVSCETESCLLVTGHRDSAASQVRINGHLLDVEGGRNWRVRLPVSTVRDWSLPFARRLEVSTQGMASQQVLSQQAVLPIGLLGHVPDLASLVITLH